MTDKTSKYRKTTPVIAGLLIVFSGATSAAWVQVDFSGTVGAANLGNALELSIGDTVTGTATYDSSLLTGIGSEQLLLGESGEGFGGSLTMNMGVVSYSGFDDVQFFNDVFPGLIFNDGNLIGFDFLVEDKPDAGNFFQVLGADWSYFADDGLTVTGLWDTFSDSAAVAVPEPSTLALLGLGGLGLFGWRKKAP